ncbi:MAG TPA: PadR family transcriptional regulator [Roseiflexaceae bacterium]|nr:PadR family transcriptional regulator [Roseiflexaceae bacterium]
MPLAYAILASLDFQPMTGYDLKKFFDRSVGHFWTTTQSHIYRALDQLQTEGWVAFRLIPHEGKPSRKEYSLTESGRAELRRWLTTPLPPGPVREAWLIQLFFSHTSTDAQIVALIEERGQQIRQILAVYRQQTSIPEEAAPGLERARALWQMTLDYGIAFYEFELRWNEEMLKRIKHLPPLSGGPSPRRRKQK